MAAGLTGKWHGGASVLAVVATAALAGCVGAPTYGTGKAADQQLLEDVTGVLSLGPSDKPQIEYKPRPELVKPADARTLPVPQESVTLASAGAWPESPEQRRMRLQAEATLGRDDINYRPEVGAPENVRNAPRIERNARGDDLSMNASLTSTQSQRDEFNRRIAQSNQGSPTTRRYLSEPPLVYRQPAATAAANDVGEDEWRKEKRREAGAKKKDGWSLGDLWPF